MEFPRLQTIYLNGNSIVSVEGFNRIYFPELRSLEISKLAGSIGQNHIKTVADIRKILRSKIMMMKLGKDMVMKINFQQNNWVFCPPSLALMS